jgi:TerC family integral membrane protein
MKSDENLILNPMQPPNPKTTIREPIDRFNQLPLTYARSMQETHLNYMSGWRDAYVTYLGAAKVTYDGTRLTTRVAGHRALTPMAMVMLAIGTTDLLFALDSIPAVFGITSEAYLVFTVNAFALMGLRQLYFLLQGILGRLQHLNRGLAIILAFIGVKLLLEAVHETTSLDVPIIPVWFSLAFIVGVLAVTAITSVYATRSKDANAPDTSEEEV